MFNLFKTLFSRPETKAPSLGTIKLSDDRGKFWKFNPKDDITPLECAKLMPLFAMLPLCLESGLNWQGYLEKYDLWRHFEVDK
jgi:hypothetical protein